MRKLILAGLLLLVSFLAVSQREQAEYLEAKRLFDLGRYSSAKAAFSLLVESGTFGAYAGFYYGLSTYYQGDTTVALDMWRQLLLQFPEWDQKQELLFWLAYVNFERGSYDQALNFSSELTKIIMNSEIETALVDRFIEPLPIEDMKRLYEQRKDSRVLATILARKLNAVPREERDMVLIDFLVKKWEIELHEMETIYLPVIKKKSYDIGLFLPFLFESLSNTGVITQNTLVMDMYQGMLLAAEDLNQAGKPVRLLPYDTKRKEEVTRKILEKPEIKNLDLIVGPLYPGPNNAVNEFSLNNLINTINPISSNSEVIDENVLSFLAKPSYETIAIKTAELAIAENQDNKYAMIFYEDNERDSSFAAVYKARIEADSFKVVWYKALDQENSKPTLDALVEQYDAYLTQDEADLIQLIPGRFVHQRRIRRDEMERMAREQKNDLISKERKFNLPISYDDLENEIVFYEKRYTIKQDSIGHILGATRSNLYANNIIVAVETRNDNTRLYSYGDWLDFTMLSYSQIDRLGIAMPFPDFIDKSNYSFQELEERLHNRYKTNPSINHYRGYELIWYVGNMMHRYGKYFQKGVKGGDYQKGRVFEGFKYETGNDNRVVPIVRFNSAQLEVVNRSNYED